MRHLLLIGLVSVGVAGLAGCGSENSIAINTSPPPTADPDPEPGPNDQPLAGDQQVLDLINNQTNEVADPIEINGLGLVFNENADAEVYGDLLPDS